MNQATPDLVLLDALLPSPGGTAAAQDPEDRVDVAILSVKRIAAVVREPR